MGRNAGDTHLLQVCSGPGLPLYVAVCLLALLGLSRPAAATDTVRAAAVTAELRQHTRELLDAIAPGRVAVWDRLLDPRVIQVDENDVVHDKDQILAELKPLAPGLVGNLEIAEFRVALAGNVAAVTHEDAEFLDYHGQVIRSRFRMTDTWIKTPAGWRLLASQVLAVLQDPPAFALDPAALCAYSGQYELTPELTGTIRCQGGELSFERPGKSARRFLAEVPDVFFEPGAPRTRRIFQRDPSGRITGFVDRREARDIHWKRVAPTP